VLFFDKGSIRHLIIWETVHFKALTWIWLSKVNGPALPKERCIKVDKAPPGKKLDLRKIFPQQRPTPPSKRTRCSIVLEKSTIEVHHTNRYTTIYIYIYIMGKKLFKNTC